MKLPKYLKKINQFLIKNYFIAIFLGCIVFVGFVSVYRLFFAKPTYIYARVKVGQGLWWASSQKPSIWMIKSIKKGDVEKDLAGKSLVEILAIRYYPSYLTNQYDVFLDVKLKVSGNKKTGEYSFNRSSIGVGAPIDFEFPTSQFSGTITELSPNLIKDKYQTKTVYLTKTYGYVWEYNGIKIGDKFFDGENNVVEILDKTGSETMEINPTYKGTINPAFNQVRQDILIKARLLVKNIDNKLVFGNDQIVSLGRNLYLATDTLNLNDYTVAGIE